MKKVYHLPPEKASDFVIFFKNLLNFPEKVKKAVLSALHFPLRAV